MSSVGAVRHPDPPGLMTIGELSRRTGASVKVLRRYDGLGLLYSAGRSQANYRLFDETALWCVAVITGLRNLGLTVSEIHELADVYLGTPDEPIGRHITERLQAVQDRLDLRIAELAELRRLLGDFQVANRGALAGRGADFREEDPRRASAP